jgi:hypothetical protein
VHFANDAKVGVKIQEPLDRAIDASPVPVKLRDRRSAPQEAARWCASTT